MHVVLINPPQIFSRAQVAAGITPPLGIAYLAAYALERGYEVDVIDAVGEAPQQIEPFFKSTYLRGLSFDQITGLIDSQASLIGISNLFTFAYPAVAVLCERIRAAHPEVPIVLGGPHPSAQYEEILQQSAVDFVIMGEAEESFIELCEAVDGKRSFDEVSSLVRRVKIPDSGGTDGADKPGELSINRQAPRLKDLNASKVPYPARHLLPMDSYIKAQEAHGPVKERWTSMISSRGCPYGCTFCESRRTKWVARTASDVVDEMEHCLTKYGISEFHFEDDNLTVSKKRVLELCDEIRKRELKVRWQTPNGIRASVADEEMLTAMRDSGCTHISIAPETGSQRVLDEIIEKGRDFQLDQLKEVGAVAHRLGIRVAAYFVLGVPGETVDDIKMTIDYARSLGRVGVDEAAFSLFIPLPGTPLWDQCAEQRKKLDYLDLLCIGDLSRAISWSDQITNAQLHTLRRRAYLSFHMSRFVHHPGSFLKMFLNVIVGKEDTKTERVMRTLIRRIFGRTSRSDSGRRSEQDLNAYPYDERRTLKLLLHQDEHYAYNESLLKTMRLVAGDFLRVLFRRA